MTTNRRPHSAGHQRKIEWLRDLPRLGPRRSDIAGGARLLIEGHFLVLYETHPDTDEGPVEAVEIVSIVDGRRDLNELFSLQEIIAM
jgi:plasmid stabilization system protein ParE